MVGRVAPKSNSKCSYCKWAFSDYRIAKKHCDSCVENGKTAYEEATDIIGKVLKDLSNDDRIKVATTIIQCVSKLEDMEYFCMKQQDGEVETVMLTGESAKCIAKYIENNRFIKTGALK